MRRSLTTCAVDLAPRCVRLDRRDLASQIIFAAYARGAYGFVCPHELDALPYRHTVLASRTLRAYLKYPTLVFALSDTFG